MRFSPTPEQQQLGDMVQRFFAEQYGFEARRKILGSREGWSREIWSKLAELGLLSLQVPEEQGGIHPAVVETLLTAGATGAAMLLEPWISSAVIATVLVRELGLPQQREELLAPMAAGERIAVTAHFEGDSRYDLQRVATSARRSGGAWLLNGSKSVVLHAPAADLLLISARTSGAVSDAAGISVFVVGRDAPSVTLSAYRTLDGICAADVQLADARGTLLGAEGTAFAAIAAAFDYGLAARCAEAVGALQAALDKTVEYTKTRHQFGVPIASFQALQHRMADMLIHVEQARSMSYLAAMRAAEPPSRERRRALSAAKVVVGNACRFVGQEAVQLHGGMGVTDEMAISHVFRRLTALELALGDTAHHLERFVAASAQVEGT
ncbi:MAG TPA: acyl-CoA dehydrogenase [Myxococcales bacterium]|nr:acyl-CoA dehydrogenase [Myxococcales bacterium]